MVGIYTANSFPRGGTPMSAQGARGGTTGLNLQPGQLVGVKWIKPVSPEIAIVQIGGKLFRAALPSGMSFGSHANLVLEAKGPPLVFRLPDPAATLLAKLFHPPEVSFARSAVELLAGLSGETGGDRELASLAANIRALLGLPRGTVQLADALRSYIPNSGIFHEAALLEGSGGEDLKGYLLRWLALKPEGLFSRYARVMLAHIEAYQARSVGSEHLVVPFALVWGEEPINGEIRFEAPHGKAGETETAGGVRINLSMPGLGPVEVGLWWTGQALSVRLAVVTPVEQLVRERAPELLETLTGTAGLTVRSLQVETRLESVPHPDGPLFEVTA